MIDKKQIQTDQVHNKDDNKLTICTIELAIVVKLASSPKRGVSGVHRSMLLRNVQWWNWIGEFHWKTMKPDHKSCKHNLSETRGQNKTRQSNSEETTFFTFYHSHKLPSTSMGWTKHRPEHPSTCMRVSLAESSSLRMASNFLLPQHFNSMRQGIS